MKEKMNKFKSQIIEKTTDIMSEYGRYIGGGIVVLTLFVICGTTLAQRVADSKMPSGIMMTVSTVADGKEAFSGNTFYVDGITYTEMVNVDYEDEHASKIDKTENEIEEILAARQEERQKKAAKEVLEIEQQDAEGFAAYDPNNPEASQNLMVAAGNTGNSGNTTTVGNTSPQYTYADENGTYLSLGEFELTAYCPCPICCGIYSNMENPTTASGTRATQGRTIATDTSVIPFGSKVVINGKIYTAEDTGGAIKGKRIDIYFESHTEALYFGRQKAQVYLVQ